MTMPRNTRDMLERAATELPDRSTPQLERLHRGAPRRDRVRKVGVVVVAATIGLVVMGVAVQLRPGTDRVPLAARASGRILVTRADDPTGDRFDLDIHVVDAATGAVDPLEAGPRADYFPAWSPDGQRIAFATGGTMATDPDVYPDPYPVGLVVRDGGAVDVLIEDEVSAISWSPDGRQLAVVVFKPADPEDATGIYVVDTDSYARRFVLAGGFQSVDWAPDGSHLLAAGLPHDLVVDGAVQGQHVFRVPLDGGAPVQLTDEPGYVHSAFYSPDGSRIVLAKSPNYDDADYRSDLFVMDANGAALVKIIDHPGFDSFPVWSPDGRWIAFASDRGASEQQQRDNADGGLSGVGVYVMDPDGGQVREVAPGGDGVFLPTSWAP